MQFELTKEYIDQLINEIDNSEDVAVFQKVKDMHPADIAEIYDELSVDQARFVHVLLDDEVAAEVLVQLEEDDRERFLKVLPSEVIARQLIDNLNSDDAADVIGELSEEKQEEVISFLEDLDHAGDIVDLLNYHEDTAGGLMAKELITVNENWTIMTCLKEMRKQAEDVDEIYYVYVIDDNEVLKGTLSLKKLLLTASNRKIANIINTDVILLKRTLHLKRLQTL